MSNRGKQKRLPIKCPDCGKPICDILIDEKGEVGFAFKIRFRGQKGELVIGGMKQSKNDLGATDGR